jgi:uncharacterized protein (DUF983 family)
MFDGYMTVAPVCTACGLDLASMDSGDGPAVLGIFVLGALVVPLALWFDHLLQPPLWLTATVFGVLLVGLTIGGLRPAKAAFVWANFRYRRAT